MKRILVFLGLSLLLVACDKEKVINADKLPADANGFIRTHFAAQQVTQTVREWDDLKISYHVYLNNGTRLDFDWHGHIKKMDSNNALPSSAFASLIVSYVQTHYPGQDIRFWEDDDATQDVRLSGGVKLEFDKHGNFLRIG